MPDPGLFIISAPVTDMIEYSKSKRIGHKIYLFLILLNFNLVNTPIVHLLTSFLFHVLLWLITYILCFKQ